MTDGRPCGRPDGHTGHHRSVEGMERRRMARREWDRRAQAEGRKHWQRHPVSRYHYDLARNMNYNGPVRNCLAIVGMEERGRERFGWAGPSQADFDAVEEAKARGRVEALRWYRLDRDNVMVKLGPRRWLAVPRDSMAATDPRVDPTTAVPYPARDAEELRRREILRRRLVGHW